MSRFEKIMWSMIIVYTAISIGRGEMYSLALLSVIILLRLIIWRLVKQ